VTIRLEYASQQALASELLDFPAQDAGNTADDLLERTNEVLAAITGDT
jgi:hypothetical protein